MALPGLEEAVQQSLWQRMTGGTGNPEDLFYMLRYGVPSSEKYRLAVQGLIPGAMPIGTDDDLAREERRAAGFLFGQRWPTLATPGTGLANLLRFWEPRYMHDAAMSGARAGAERPGIADILLRMGR